MPIHDWARVPAGLFHHFHQDWSIRITNALNAGLLPKGLSALVERSNPRIADLKRIERRTVEQQYAARANRIVVKKNLARTLAVIEIVSPGNKDSRSALRGFVEKTMELLSARIHVLIVDLFPPTAHSRFGIHNLIWNEISVSDFTLPAGNDRVLASYMAGSELSVYIDEIGVGDSLPELPLFLAEDRFVNVPLESTYTTSWNLCPEDYRTAVETGVIPDPDAE